ncbi:MAG: uracil-DNA glycosylase [Actinobacteria bacterium]|nr:uracil-DNA glycosylase [Actinomycetota bacterium]MBU1866830.1 uracil-DNA glycosylase [Actinomycetota bacterium]
MSEAARELAELAVTASTCTNCSLADSRTQVVFGDGSPTASIMFVGEAPGFHEDQQGIPFVGAAGQLLDRLLAEIGVARRDVYIANVLKCRPPGNRDPRPEEIEACKGYLADQLRLIDPPVVITLGNFATKLLLKREVGITKTRGQVYPWWNRHLIPTFHPAAALRGGDRILEQMRRDFALARAVLDDAVHEEADPVVEQLGLF